MTFSLLLQRAFHYYLSGARKRLTSSPPCFITCRFSQEGFLNYHYGTPTCHITTITLNWSVVTNFHSFPRSTTKIATPNYLLTVSPSIVSIECHISQVFTTAHLHRHATRSTYSEFRSFFVFCSHCKFDRTWSKMHTSHLAHPNVSYLTSAVLFQRIPVLHSSPSSSKIEYHFNICIIAASGCIFGAIK